MTASNVIQFPAARTHKRKPRKLPISTPHPDDVFLDDLLALQPEDQELWRTLIHIAAKWAREGIEHKMDITRLSK